MKQHFRLFGLTGAAFVLALTPALAGIVQQVENFEGRTDWFATQGAGFDRGKAFAHRGTGNGYVRNTSGWSAVNSWYRSSAPSGSECAVQAWIRVSPNVTNGYFSVRAGDGVRPGSVITEVRLVAPAPANPSNRGYNPYTLRFRSTGAPVLVYVGNWGNGRDSWLQIDDVVFECRY